MKLRRGNFTPSLIIGLLIFSTISVIALLSIFWLPYSLENTDGGRLSPPSGAHWFGTDKLGRDLLARLMVGARIALSVGFSSVAIAAIVGLTLGLAAGFAQRWLHRRGDAERLMDPAKVVMHEVECDRMAVILNLL